MGPKRPSAGARLVMPGLLERAYRRLGGRYPMAVLLVAVRLEHVLVVVGVAVLALYVRMSLLEFALLSLAAVVGQEFYIAFTRRYFRARLAPLVEWLDPGGKGSATSAWEAAASMPFELLRLWWRGGYPVLAGMGWCLFAVWLLGLPGWAIPVLFPIIQVLLAYANGVACFIVERGMQPVLDDLAGDLSEEAEVDAIGLPLGRRLLLALGALTLTVGVVVAGFVEPGHPGLGGMAVAALISVGVTLTVALAFALLLATSVVAPIRRLEAATGRVARGDLAVRVPVSGSDETGVLTQAFNRMVSGLEERERLRDAFGTFVDPDLADRVARDGTDLRGEELDVSVMFMDVRGFTGLSESADAQEVVGHLNRLYDVVVPVIIRHGGHANKFIGDGLLAVFGAPERHADHADRAVAAALEIAAAVNDGAGGSLRVGLGVNSGTVVVGTIGGGGRLDFTVIGDAVNTAARVESATRQTGDDVLITSETRHRLSAAHATWDERPPIPLKGKRNAVELYAPARERDRQPAYSGEAPGTASE